MELSKRLSAVAGLVTEGASVADIGTDHGYIPIYLARKCKEGKWIAMDINSGPLERAKEHIREYGLEEKIETRLSDGLSALKPGEVHTMIAAGMGGGLVIHIMEKDLSVTAKIREFILQPQSEISKVRFYLEESGYRIVCEDMVEEDGKYYPMMKAVHGKEEKPYEEEELLYGRELLKRKHPVLKKYLFRERQIREGILGELKKVENERARIREKELEHELKIIERALQRYEK